MLITAATTLFGILAKHRLDICRDRQNERVKVLSDFRAAFADAVLNLTEHDVSSAQVVQTFRMQHLNAIQGIREYVRWYHRRGFTKAEKSYRQCGDKCLEHGVLALAASETTSYAVANRKALLESIHRLLSYAKQP